MLPPVRVLLMNASGPAATMNWHPSRAYSIMEDLTEDAVPYLGFQKHVMTSVSWAVVRIWISLRVLMIAIILATRTFVTLDVFAEAKYRISAQAGPQPSDAATISTCGLSVFSRRLVGLVATSNTARGQRERD